jgi:AcrR family transcriptional regulator
MTRRDELLGAAAELFARRGYHGASVAELGKACGMTGPALYKHFASKESMLAEMLVGTSNELLRVGRARVDSAPTPGDALRALVDWHIDFALEHRSLIVVQDRDWSSLPDDAREQVRSTQRSYVELWAHQLRALHPELTGKEAAARVHAAFGLINSTPHSALLSDDAMRAVLRDMALRALAL